MICLLPNRLASSISDHRDVYLCWDLSTGITDEKYRLLVKLAVQQTGHSVDLAKRIKTAFHSFMGTERLSIRCISAAIDEFARYHPHRLQMVNILQGRF